MNPTGSAAGPSPSGSLSAPAAGPSPMIKVDAAVTSYLPLAVAAEVLSTFSPFPSIQYDFLSLSAAPYSSGTLILLLNSMATSSAAVTSTSISIEYGRLRNAVNEYLTMTLPSATNSVMCSAFFMSTLCLQPLIPYSSFPSTAIESPKGLMPRTVRLTWSGPSLSDTLLSIICLTEKGSFHGRMPNIPFATGTPV